MQVTRAIGNSRTERARSRKRHLEGIPRAARVWNTVDVAVAGSICAVGSGGEVASQNVAVVYGHFVNSIFVAAGVQVIQGVTAEKNRLTVQFVGRAEARAKVVPMGVGTTVSSTARTVAEGVGGTQQRLAGAGTDGTGIRCFGIEENDLVCGLPIDRFRGEWSHDVPAQADIDGQPGRDLNVVLHVGSDIEVTELGFQGEMAEGGIGRSQEERRKGTPRIVLVERAACETVAGRKAAEREIAAAVLALVIVLVGPSNFKARVQRVPSMSPEPVVIEAYAQFAVDGERFPIRVHTPRCWHERISRK